MFSFQCIPWIADTVLAVRLEVVPDSLNADLAFGETAPVSTSIVSPISPDDVVISGTPGEMSPVRVTFSTLDGLDLQGFAVVVVSEAAQFGLAPFTASDDDVETMFDAQLQVRRACW